MFKNSLPEVRRGAEDGSVQLHQDGGAGLPERDTGVVGRDRPFPGNDSEGITGRGKRIFCPSAPSLSGIGRIPGDYRRMAGEG
jgi:hypothetical protein